MALITFVALFIATAVVHGNKYHAKRGVPQSLGDIRGVAIYAHNAVRRQHQGTPDLVWDGKLASDAEKYALTMAQSGSFRHDSSNSDGENLYAGSGPSAKPFSIAAFLWYEERARFDYGAIFKYNFYGIGKLGHFTQMVWSNSLKVGCAGATVNNGNVKTYYVCRYSPPGNVLGKFDDYVKPVKGNFKIPSSPSFFEKPKSSVSSSCKDGIPSYCATLNKSMCHSPIFGSINRNSCKKTCQVC